MISVSTQKEQICFISCTVRKMATSQSSANASRNPDVDDGFDKKNDDRDVNSNFECNICLDIARDAVVSLCGHLFW